MTLSITSPGPNVYSPEVEQLQNNLVTLEFVVRIDGRFGEETRQALASFQSTYGLPVDGVYGPNTASELTQAVTMYLAAQEPVNGKPYTYIDINEPRLIPEVMLAGVTIDWKWILLGLGAAVLIFRVMRK